MWQYAYRLLFHSNNSTFDATLADPEARCLTVKEIQNIIQFPADFEGGDHHQRKYIHKLFIPNSYIRLEREVYSSSSKLIRREVP
jgi:hypothetical protein